MRLHDNLYYQVREHPDEEFAVQGDRRLTYREAVAETNRLANAFVSAGLQIGDRVAVLSKNSVEYAVLYYGASKAGVVPVPLNYRLAADEYVSAIDGMRGELKTVDRFIAVDAPGASGWQDYRGWLAQQPATAPE